jgi:hypothetical protein
MMSGINREKLDKAQGAGRRMVGAVYKRTRLDEAGRKAQRAEIRFDDIAGCLRTPAGGSSRQTIVVVDGKNVRSRLISPRETARLMGLPEDYGLPSNYNEAYHLTGDGVAVPVVRHLAEHIFEPLLAPRDALAQAAVRPKADYVLVDPSVVAALGSPSKEGRSSERPLERGRRGQRPRPTAPDSGPRRLWARRANATPEGERGPR